MTMAGQTSSSASIKGYACYIQGKTQSGSMQGKVSQPTLREPEPDSQLTKKIFIILGNETTKGSKNFARM